MNGSYVHERIVGAVDGAFRAIGAETMLQAWAGTKIQRGFIDLLTIYDGRTYAIEVERTARRIDRDLRKAKVVGADELWIVVPHQRVARQVWACLEELGVQDNEFLFVLTLGQAVSRVKSLGV